MLLQLEFFQKNDQEIIQEEIQDLKESTSKVRKSLFADHAKLARLVLELHERLELIEKNICTSSPQHI